MVNKSSLVAVLTACCLISLETGASGGPTRAPSDDSAAVTEPTFPDQSGGVKLPSARLEFQGSSYGFIIGGTSGSGKLNFQDEEFPFSISGRSLATIGVANIDAIGVVYDLDNVGDFPGTYTSAEHNITLGRGGGSALLKNENDVMIELQMMNTGGEITLGGSRYQITLE
jgi:hypothetical protein